MHAASLMVHNPVGVGYAYGVQLKPISYVTHRAMKNGWCEAESCVTEAGAVQVTRRINTTGCRLRAESAPPSRCCGIKVRNQVRAGLSGFRLRIHLEPVVLHQAARTVRTH